MVVKKLINGITLLLLFAGLIESVWGLGQFLRIWPSGNSRYVFTGSFFNPGPYCGFLAMIMSFAVFEWKLLKIRQHWGQGLVGMLCTLMLIFIPAGRSRAAWLALGASLVYFIFFYYRKTFRSWLLSHKNLTIVGGGVLIIAIGLMYHFKKDSADGRLFIWKNAIQAISESPWSGYGWDNVAGIYGEKQEAYFASGNGSKSEIRIADAPEYIYNEYLHMAMAWGLPVLFLIFLLSLYTLYVGHVAGAQGFTAGLLSFLVFAAFSYPLKFPEFCASLFLLITGIYLSAISKLGGPVRFLSGLIGLGCLMAILYYGQWTYKRHQYVMEWKQHTKTLQELYPDMLWNARFLFDYGQQLHKSRKYTESDEVMKAGMRVSSDPMFLVIIAKNAWYQHHPNEAEHWLLKATNRVPNRIYPYFLLAKLYGDSICHNKEKFQWAADIVANREPKVQSLAVRQMREEIYRLREEWKD